MKNILEKIKSFFSKKETTIETPVTIEYPTINPTKPSKKLKKSTKK